MNGFFPTTEQGLQALVIQPDTDPKPTRWYQLYKDMPKDPWQNNYIYICPGIKNPNSYDLYSAGPNRIDAAREPTFGATRARASLDNNYMSGDSGGGTFGIGIAGGFR